MGSVRDLRTAPRAGKTPGTSFCIWNNKLYGENFVIPIAGFKPLMSCWPISTKNIQKYGAQTNRLGPASSKMSKQPQKAILCAIDPLNRQMDFSLPVIAATRLLSISTI